MLNYVFLLFSEDSLIGQAVLQGCEHCINMDLNSIVTPVNVSFLATLLPYSKYDNQEIDFLADGFKNSTRGP